jgi:hypothetical protein
MNKQTSHFYYYLLFFVTSLLFISNLQAQIITKSYQIPKLKILQYEYDNQRVKILTFDGAITTDEFPTIPVFADRTEVNQHYTSYQYTLFNLKYEPLTFEEIAFIPAEYVFTEPDVDIKTASDEGRFYAMLSFFPFVKNSNGQYLRLVSCDIRFEGVKPVSVAKRSVLKNSVLASGTWYKIAVNTTGLHKVTFDDLKKIGVSVSGLRSSSIALFGNGGGAISDINPEVQIDDLLECSIMMKDDGNGVFDENSYFVFYAQGPHTWEYNAGIFTHNYNIYSDNACYFINVDPGIGEKKRVKKESFNQMENGTITTFTHYDFYENDEVNFGESGREWFGESFHSSSSKTFNFTLPELTNDMARLKIRVASTGTTSSKMDLLWGGNTRTFDVNGGSGYATISEFTQNLPFSSGNVALTLKYNSPQSSGSAYLDYIEIQAKCNLKIINGAMPFAITENIGANNFSLVKIENASAQTMIWDVTEHNAIYELTGSLVGTQFSFKTPTDKPRRFIAFNGTDYKSVTLLGKVANQNLHGLKNVNMVIVSHPNFLSEANRLAQFRAKEDGIVVEVVTPEQIYNEFSSGAQDLVAIRNYMRYLYDNDSRKIQYLLLFGRPSYDYRGRVKGTQLFVPNYQGVNSFSESLLRACDDFFGVLAFQGGSLYKDLINVAVGRFPVTTLAQAKIAVDKTINGSLRNKIALQNASQVSNFGDWRNIMAFVADDEDGGAHIRDAESASGVIGKKMPAFNFDKIYCDAYKQVSNAGGHRYPDVNKAINMRMGKGALVFAYYGHGGGNGWAHERILEISDINNWKNKYNQPLMITLTCSFGWYDRQAISPAELAFLNDNGGVCSIITTSRVTWSGSDFGTNQLYVQIGEKLNNRYKTIGEIHRLAINNSKHPSGGTGTQGGTNMIYLMGDPAMKINIPNHNVETDEVFVEDAPKEDTSKIVKNNKPYIPDTLSLEKIVTMKALTKVTVKGRVTDEAGNTLTGFNGNIFPSIFDKAVKQKTLGQDPGSPVMEFEMQKNIIFKGNATVKEGEFKFSFFVPKDITYEPGRGKISYYAASENDDAAGYYDKFLIGGISDKPITDTKGPDIEIFLNDDKFVPGGITNPDPILFLKLKDEYGINTTGNGVGHDLVAILNNDEKEQMILNDFFLANENSYNSGTVRYQLQDLTPGSHTIKVRAWDIFNNPSEASLDFVVKSDEKLKLAHVLNYPNPFTTRTSFYFEHNQPIETFDILIHIFTVSGKLVKTIHDTQFLEGNRSNAIEWDGRDEYGDKIGKGVYLYRLKVRNSQGETIEKIEKIAIL